MLWQSYICWTSTDAAREAEVSEQRRLTKEREEAIAIEKQMRATQLRERELRQREVKQVKTSGATGGRGAAIATTTSRPPPPLQPMLTDEDSIDDIPRRYSPSS